MPIDLNKREYRKIDVRNIETRTEEDGRMIVEGYAATFNQPYLLWEYENYKISEQVDRNAFGGKLVVDDTARAAAALNVEVDLQIVQKIQQEFGSFDAYLWSFTGGKQIDGHWERPQDIPTVSEVSVAMGKDMKKRGIGFVGPVITYSFLQSIGMVNDHLADCEYR